jgi:hypothetical protein
MRSSLRSRAIQHVFLCKYHISLSHISTNVQQWRGCAVGRYLQDRRFVYVLYGKSNSRKTRISLILTETKGSNCESGRDNFSVRVGCGDAAEVNSPKGEHFNFYSCGAANTSDAADYTVETVPHNANADAGLYMGT